MNGYHVFYQSKEVDDEFEEINYLVQVASILFWKNNQGSVKLYCNSKYLEFIKKWNLDVLYDDINTECLDNIPYKENLKKYWSFCKIEAAKHISETEKEFVILDTDFWIHNEINIDNDFQFIGYHPELMLEHPKNPYLSPTNFLNSSDVNLFDWSINPINCAFLYLNSKELVNEWYKWSVKVIQRNKELEEKGISADTIFIEQRLLPTISHTLNMNVGTLIPNTYYPHIQSDEFGNEWTPKIGFDEENQYMSWNVKHVWGLKKMYSDRSIRILVIDTVMSSLERFPDWKKELTELLKSIDDIYFKPETT